MGKRWRRISERVKYHPLSQNSEVFLQFIQHIIAPKFQPASIERNQMMLREASIYYGHFKTVMKKLDKLNRDYSGKWSVNIRALTRIVPRLYTVESDGSVGAELQDGDCYLGTDIQIDILSQSANAMKSRLTEEVIGTLQQWFRNYEKCKSMLKVLDELRFELDSRRRTVISLDGKINEAEEKAKSGDQSMETVANATSKKLNHKERKFESCLGEFLQKEEELNQSLRALLSEVKLHSRLIGHVYQILSDVPGRAYREFKEGSSSEARDQLQITRLNDHLNSETKGDSPIVENLNPFAD